MSTFNYSLHSEFAKGDRGPNASLIENILGIGCLVLPPNIKNITDLEGMFGSQEVSDLWRRYLVDPNKPVRISKKRLKTEVNSQIKNVQEIETLISGEPFEVLILDRKNSSKILTDSVLLSDNKELTDHNLLRSSRTFVKKQKLRRSKILGKEDSERVWQERMLPVLEDATSISFVERNFLKQHIESSNEGPSVMLQRILGVKTIKHLDLYAEFPGRPNVYSKEQIRNEVNSLIKSVYRQNITLNFYIGGYKVRRRTDHRGGLIFKSYAGSAYFHIKGLTWSEKIEMDHSCELFNNLAYGNVDRNFSVGPIDQEDSDSLSSLRKSIKEASLGNKPVSLPSLILKFK